LKLQGDFFDQEVLAFSSELTIDETVARIKGRIFPPSGGGEAGYVYVTNPEGHLEGVVQMRDLILSPGTVPLAAIMKRDVVSVRVDMTPEEVLEIFKKNRFLALPVCDQEGKLLGAVSLNKIAGLFQKEASAYLYQATGLDLELEGKLLHREELSHRSILKMVMLRSPWLLISILSGLAAAFILGNYFLGIETIISLILFIPIVLGLSGSMASQCAVLVIHEFSKGGASLKRLAQILVKESLLAVFAGLLTLLSVGILALILKKSLLLALAIGLAIAAAVFSSGFLGVLFPFLFVGLRLDPRIASGPFTVALCDLFALWIYLQVAYFFLSRYFKVA